MKDTSRQDKEMPNGMIQIVVADKKGDASCVSDTAQDQQVNASHGKSLARFGQTDHGGPAHTQIHAERKDATPWPGGRERFHRNTQTTTGPNKAQQTDGIQGLVTEHDGQKRGVTSSNQNINSTFVHDLKNVLDVLKRKEGMVQCGTQVQDQQTGRVDTTTDGMRQGLILDSSR